MSIIDESDDASAAATSYTDSFFDAAVAKIDAAFGKGFAKTNPALIGAMVQASATNLVAFMQAAANMEQDMYDMTSEEILEMLPDDLFSGAPKKPRKGRR